MNRALFTPLASLIVLAACGDRPLTDAGDAGSDAPTATCATPGSRRLFVSTTDYTSGALAMVGMASACARDQVAPASGDAVLSRQGDRLVVMNSGGAEDNVTFFDTTNDPPSLRCQFAARRDSETGLANPRGYVAIDAHRGYLARFSLPSLAIVDADACAITGTIDLAPFAGSSPLPYPRPIAMIGSEAWVALERLPAGLTNPTEAGAVVRIDPGTNAPIDNDGNAPGVQAIELPLPNPVGRFAVRGGYALIACVGSYARADDGGVVSIDAATHVATTLVGESALGGNVDAVIALDDDRILCRVAGAAASSGSSISVDAVRLVEWSRSTGTIQLWLEVSGYSLTEPILASDGRVYVGDRGDVTTRRPSSIRVFDPAPGVAERERAPVPDRTALPPYDIVE